MVCGASNGIGLETAVEFSKNGANVTLFARDNEKLILAKEKLIISNDQEHRILVGDFKDPKQIIDIIHRNIKNIKYNILINNSGGPKGGRIIDASIMQFNETFNRHLICSHVLTLAFWGYPLVYIFLIDYRLRTLR